MSTIPSDAPIVSRPSRPRLMMIRTGGRKRLVCRTCAGTRRGFTTHQTDRGNVVIDSYGACPDCTRKAGQ